jgi:hypothetical protein
MMALRISPDRVALVFSRVSLMIGRHAYILGSPCFRGLHVVSVVQLTTLLLYQLDFPTCVLAHSFSLGLVPPVQNAMRVRLAGDLLRVVETKTWGTGMSFQKKARKFRTVSGKTFPKSSGTVEISDGYDFTEIIAETLREAFGNTGRSIKTVMAYTGAGERTVKNWFAGKNGPNGENLVELMRNSDEILEALLLMAGRDDILAAKLLVDGRDKLVEIFKMIDELQPSSAIDDPD